MFEVMKQAMQIQSGENPYTWVRRISPYFVGMNVDEISSTLCDIVTTVSNRVGQR